MKPGTPNFLQQIGLRRTDTSKQRRKKIYLYISSKRKIKQQPENTKNKFSWKMNGQCQVVVSFVWKQNEIVFYTCCTIQFIIFNEPNDKNTEKNVFKCRCTILKQRTADCGKSIGSFDVLADSFWWHVYGCLVVCFGQNHTNALPCVCSYGVFRNATQWRRASFSYLFLIRTDVQAYFCNYLYIGVVGRKWYPQLKNIINLINVE